MENKRSPTACTENTPHHSQTWSVWWLCAACLHPSLQPGLGFPGDKRLEDAFAEQSVTKG